MSIRHLEQLLKPASIAVVGASERPGSVGATVWRNVRAGGFAGDVFAVNPKHSTLDGEPVYRRVAELPRPADLAIVCTPPATVAPLIAQLGAHGTRAAIVLTAGLDAGQKQAMLDAARPTLLRVLGPNCLGLLSPHVKLNASFAHADALPGQLGFVSQSGALVTAVLDWAKSRRIGFSHMVSLGERADVDFADLIDWLASDPHTRSILLYIESVEQPRKFMSAARAAARNKPVIVVKAGRAGRGLQAAASHTGALAGSDVVFDAAIRRAGMLRVDTLADLFMAAETLARFGNAAWDGLTIMTNGGGAGVMAADAAAQLGVALPPLDDALLATLDAFLPATWSRANPIDIIGDAPAQRYTQTLQALLDTPSAGAILLLHAPTAIVRSADIARACAPLVRQGAGRILSSCLGDAAVAEARGILEEAGAAGYDTPEEAVRAFSLIATYRANQAALLEVPTAAESAAPDVAAARAIVAQALAEGREWLDEHAAKQLLAAYGIPVVRTEAVAADADAAVAAAGRIGFPAVLKIISPELTHKSDVGGVRLDLADAGAVHAAATEMLAHVRALRPDARIAGLSVQRMVRRPAARELILGASIDPVFGPVVLFGQGGVAVEVVADTAIGLPPLNRVLARELVARTRVAKLLAAYRGRPAARLDDVCDALMALSRMLADLPELVELDINPLLADEAGVLALDARVRLHRAGGAGAGRFAITPYPAELAQEVEWAGGRILLRPIRPEDEPQHRAFLAQVAPSDLRLRFFNTRRELAPSELARLTQIDYAREMAFVATRQPAGGPAETLGVVRAAADPDNIEAEFAILVRSDLQARGLGHLLMQKMIGYLRARGTQRMVGDILNDNERMRAMARSLGLKADPHGPLDGASKFLLELQPPPDPAR